MLTALWGLESDEPLAAVQEALQDLAGKVLLLDQRRVSEIDFRIEDERNLIGYVRCGDRRVSLEEVSGWYIRPYDTRRVRSVERAGPGSPEWKHALELEHALLGWLEITEAFVVNRPSAMLANGCKPYQLQMVRRAGFAVPETLVTTDPAEVIAFWERHGNVIYKSISGVRSRVTRLGASDRGRLSDVVHCPTQFQAYVPGQDYRAHVVGEDVFGCEVRSEADDYRYATDGVPQIWATRLPREVEERAVAMTKEMGLQVAGIDLRQTPDGHWYCFEVNPSPGFTFYEQFTGQGLASAIARLLICAGVKERDGRPIFLGGEYGTHTERGSCLARQG